MSEANSLGAVAAAYRADNVVDGKFSPKPSMNKEKVTESRNKIISKLPEIMGIFSSASQGKHHSSERGVPSSGIEVNILFSDVVKEVTGLGYDISSDAPIIPTQLLRALGFSDPYNIPLRELNLFASQNKHLVYNNADGIQTSAASIVPIIIGDPLRAGVRQNQNYKDLLAFQKRANRTTITIPQYLLGNPQWDLIGEDSDVQYGSVEWTEKKVSGEKVGSGIKFTKEAQSLVPLGTIAEYMQEAGNTLSRMKINRVLSALQQGDGGTDSATILSVGVDTSGTIDLLKDVAVTTADMESVGRPVDIIIADKDTILSLELDPLVTGLNSYTGKKFVRTSTEDEIKQSAMYTLFRNANIPTNNLLMLSKRHAVAEYIVSPLTVRTLESSNLMGTVKYVMTETFTIVRLQPNGCLMINGNAAKSAVPLPTDFDRSIFERQTFNAIRG